MSLAGSAQSSRPGSSGGASAARSSLREAAGRVPALSSAIGQGPRTQKERVRAVIAPRRHAGEGMSGSSVSCSVTRRARCRRRRRRAHTCRWTGGRHYITPAIPGRCCTQCCELARCVRMRRSAPSRRCAACAAETAAKRPQAARCRTRVQPLSYVRGCSRRRLRVVQLAQRLAGRSWAAHGWCVSTLSLRFSQQALVPCSVHLQGGHGVSATL